MTRHGAAYPRPDAIDPWRHNELVRRAKRYRRLSRDFRTATGRNAAAMRRLGESAARAAESMRELARALGPAGEAARRTIR